MTSPPPSTERRTLARERILRATVTTLATEGFGGTTARAIALTGGFAPGVIYYHFTDLDDLFLATLRFTSGERLERYRQGVLGVASAVELLDQLRRLYAEDTEGGHIAAVQELIAAASASTRLSGQIQDEVRRWQELAEEVISGLLAGTPFAAMVPVPQAAEAIVATYLGLELLMHLDGDRSKPDTFFASAGPAAVMLDVLRQE